MSVEPIVAGRCGLIIRDVKNFIEALITIHIILMVQMVMVISIAGGYMWLVSCPDPPRTCEKEGLVTGNCKTWTLDWTMDWTVDWTVDWRDQNSCMQAANVTKAMKGCLQLCLRLLPSLLQASSPRFPRSKVTHNFNRARTILLHDI